MADWMPLPAKERKFALDVLRGISLLGIFVVNMLSFEFPYLYINPYDWFKAGDQTVAAWIQVFFQSSFYPVFSLLFGYGLMFQKQRAEKAGANFFRFAFRRLTVLLVFSLVHAFLIWSGDILAAYAVFGMILLPFLKLDGKVLIYAGAVLFFVPHLLSSLYLMVMALEFPNTSVLYADLKNVTDSLQVYGSGSYMDITKRRFLDWYHVYGPPGGWNAFFSIFPLMMAGAGICGENWLQDGRITMKKWLLFFFVCFASGLFCKLLPILAAANVPFMYIQQTIGGTLLSGAYIALVMLAVQLPHAKLFLNPVAKAGRMPLSIYIGQSVIGTMIFYAYGLGLYGKLSVTVGMGLTVLIYLIQMMLADMWLLRFRYGPLEWIWRILSYGKKP
ncbi:DUF418 domain-containing protein [Weizmannia acidilactici]|uniref:DUF418 domain-containing protein n=1 Tax=Weizmannia acidilactici TaxID=2607726 RepID=UPI00124C034D|nr:DUF418 domain-containing protein [Weizmannia acidilactici]